MKESKHTLKISKAIEQKCRNKFLIQSVLKEKSNVKEILALTNESFGHLCGIANDFLKQKRYSDAANAFLFLATVAGDNAESWIGFGMASQYLGDFENAIDAYEVAATCQIDNPLPYLYLAKVFFALHQRERASEAIELALFHAADKAEYQQVKEEALRAQRHLGKHDFP